MSWQDTVDMTVWENEPEPGLESRYTRGASDDWHSWNEWAVEKEVADFCGQLVDILDPQVVVETGVSQGFVTRRIVRPGNHPYLYEADPIIRERIPVHVEPDPTPDEFVISQADLLIFDSHWPERISELKLWAENGKPGSFVFMHDVKPVAPRGTGHRTMWDLVRQLNIPHMLFDNPRGSVLLYRPDDWDMPKVNWPQVANRKQETGTVMVVQIDPGTVSGGYSHCMAQMLLHSGSVVHGGIIHDDIRKLGGPRVYHHRDGAVRYFLETDADWLLQIDSDMIFPKNLLDELMAVADADERPIVAGHCYMWRGESGPLPVMWRPQPEAKNEASMMLFEDYPMNGLVKVAATGSACILIHRRVFETIQASDPEYTFPWYEETMYGKEPVGEDVTFCVRARRAGFPVYVHTGLDIGHEKMMTMNNQFFAEYRATRRFVITGLPRSGTGYMSQILLKAGVACGHEEVHTSLGVEWGTHWGDSSWLAVPQLSGFGGPVIHVMRHPIDVFSSLIGIEFFNPDAENAKTMARYGQFANTHVPWPNGYTWQQYTLWFMKAWVERIEKLQPHMVIKVEEITAESLQHLVMMARPPRPTRPSVLEDHLSKVPKHWNTLREGRPVRLSVEQIEQLVGPELVGWLKDLCVRWEYDPN